MVAARALPVLSAILNFNKTALKPEQNSYLFSSASNSKPVEFSFRPPVTAGSSLALPSNLWNIPIKRLWSPYPSRACLSTLHSTVSKQKSWEKQNISITLYLSNSRQRERLYVGYTHGSSRMPLNEKSGIQITWEKTQNEQLVGIFVNPLKVSGPGSVVGIATGYGLDGPGILSR